MKIERMINELLVLLIAIIMVACAPATPEGSGLQVTDAPVQLPTTEPTISVEPTLPTEENDATSGIRPNDDLLENPLQGTDWDLISLNGKEPTGDITLQFDPETVGGSDGCNGYGATYTVDGNAISFDTSGFMSTMMACEPMEIMEEGRAYLDALATATSYQLDAGTLTIQTEQGELGFAIPENTALEGITWTLTSISEENGVVSMAIDRDIFILLQDGALSGSTGCNNLGGSYTLGGDELSFDQLHQTLMACLDDDVSQREAQLIEVLNNTVRYSINRQGMTLEDADGNALATFAASETSEEEQMNEEVNIDVSGTSWTLSEIVTDGIVSEAVITAMFDNGQLAGNAGCNRYTTSCEIDGTKITLAPIATTRRLCDEVTNVDEQAFLLKMAEVRSFSATNELLTLKDDKGNSLLVFTQDVMAEEDEGSAETTEKTFYIASEQADCVGVGPQKCLLIKEDPNADYLFFYDHITGFEWEAGFEYEIRVNVTEVENPPADASTLQYELIEVVNKTAVEK